MTGARPFRKCPECGEVKPRSAFCSSRKHPTSTSRKCQSCLSYIQAKKRLLTGKTKKSHIFGTLGEALLTGAITQEDVVACEMSEDKPQKGAHTQGESV